MKKSNDADEVIRDIETITQNYKSSLKPTIQDWTLPIPDFRPISETLDLHYNQEDKDSNILEIENLLELTSVEMEPVHDKKPDCYYDTFDFNKGHGLIQVPLYYWHESPLLFNEGFKKPSVLISPTLDSNYISVRTTDDKVADAVLKCLTDIEGDIHLNLSTVSLSRGLYDWLLYKLFFKYDIRIFVTTELLESITDFSQDYFEGTVRPAMLETIIEPEGNPLIDFHAPVLRRDGGLVFAITKKEALDTEDIDYREFVCSYDKFFSYMFYVYHMAIRKDSTLLIVVPNSLRRLKLEKFINEKLKHKRRKNITVTYTGKAEAELVRNNYDCVVILDITTDKMRSFIADSDIVDEIKKVKSVFGVSYTSDIPEQGTPEFFTYQKVFGAIRISL